MKKLSAVAVCMLVSLSVLGPASSAAALTPNQLRGKAEAKIFTFINKGRVNRGLSQLTLHTFIRKEDRTHSKNMHDGGFFSHAGFCDNNADGVCGPSDGIANNSRIERIQSKDAGINASCENIAWAAGYTDYRQAAKVIYKGWVNSTGHYNCMFDVINSKNEAAVGIFYDADGTSSGPWAGYAPLWIATFIAVNDTSP